jgi:hypothetical protein
MFDERLRQCPLERAASGAKFTLAGGGMRIFGLFDQGSGAKSCLSQIDFLMRLKARKRGKAWKAQKKRT